VEAFHETRVRQEKRHRSNAGWRLLVQERLGRGRIGVGPAGFIQEPLNRQVVAQNAHAALRGFGLFGNLGNIGGSIGDMSEDIKLDSCLQGFRLLVSVESFKDSSRVGRSSCRGRHSLYFSGILVSHFSALLEYNRYLRKEAVMRRAFTLAILVFTTVVLVSCSGVHQVVSTLQDLQKVQAELAKTLGQDAIRVNLNNGSLNIALVNSPLKELPADQKRAKALEIARLAYRSDPSRSTLSAVSVAFAVHRTYLGFFNYDNSTDSFGFEIAQLTT
jgi:hypothetical protein